MKFFVTEKCIGCGLCPSVCPDVFKMSDEGVAVAIAEDVAPDREDDAKDAQAGCPVDAIEEI